MRQILIVEDDRELNNGLTKALRTTDIKVVSCYDMKTAREQILCMKPSLVVLDINLPDGSGLALLREIREKVPELPVILLTANDTDEDVVRGLESGANDYITKPFSLAILRARVNAQLRSTKIRDSQQPSGSRVYDDGKYRFDFENMIFEVGGESVELSKTEQKLLWVLTRNCGNLVPRGMLVDKVWSDGADYVDENALSVSVNRLRNKLGEKEIIKTIYGQGYKWDR